MYGLSPFEDDIRTKVTVTLEVTVTSVEEMEMVKREIESTDAAIDRLVYELYGLSEEEIRIVEGQ